MELLGQLLFVFSPGWLTDRGRDLPISLYCTHRSVGFLLNTSFFLSLPRSNKAAANDFQNHSRTIVDIDTYSSTKHHP